MYDTIKRQKSEKDVHKILHVSIIFFLSYLKDTAEIFDNAKHRWSPYALQFTLVSQLRKHENSTTVSI